MPQTIPLGLVNRVFMTLKNPEMIVMRKLKVFVTRNLSVLEELSS